MMGSSDEVRVRTATQDDVAAILRFWLLAAETTDRDDRADALYALIAWDAGALLLAERCNNGELVGSLIAGWDGWRARLYRLAVHPRYRRRGIASRLLRAAEERLRDLGAVRADAMMLVDNAEAHPLWEAAGYRSQEQWRRWVHRLA